MSCLTVSIFYCIIYTVKQQIVEVVCLVNQKELVAWYVIRFLDTFREMTGISNERFIELLNKYKLATNIEDDFENIQSMMPEEYGEGLIEALRLVGENI